jgi:hypothetical protein
MTETAPWTIKAVSIETRQMAVKAAHAQDQTMAQWLGDAVVRLANQQAGNLVIPPGKPEAMPPAQLPDVDLAGLAAAINASVAATLAAGGIPSRSLGRDAAATLRRYMRAARGLPERQTIPRNRQTSKLIEGS